MFNPSAEQRVDFSEEAHIRFILGRLEQTKNTLSSQGTLWWRTTQAQQYLITKLKEVKH